MLAELTRVGRRPGRDRGGPGLTPIADEGELERDRRARDRRSNPDGGRADPRRQGAGDRRDRGRRHEGDQGSCGRRRGQPADQGRSSAWILAPAAVRRPLLALAGGRASLRGRRLRCARVFRPLRAGRRLRARDRAARSRRARAGHASGCAAVRVRPARAAARPRDAVVALSGGPGRVGDPVPRRLPRRDRGRRCARATCSSSTSAAPASRPRSCAAARSSAAARRTRRGDRPSAPPPRAAAVALHHRGGGARHRGRARAAGAREADALRRLVRDQGGAGLRSAVPGPGRAPGARLGRRPARAGPLRPRRVRGRAAGDARAVRGRALRGRHRRSGRGPADASSAELARAPLAGHVVGGDGRARPRARRGRAARPAGRGRLRPGRRGRRSRARCASALHGDPHRCCASAHAGARPAASRSRRGVFDVGTFVATSCADQGFPWSPAPPPAIAGAPCFTAAPSRSPIPRSRRSTARRRALARCCAPAPSGRRRAGAADAGGAAAGRADADPERRRPTCARRSRPPARWPRACRTRRCSWCPGAGHSVLPSDLSGCADRAVRQFFADQPGRARAARARRAPLLRLLGPARAEPVAPAALGEVDRRAGTAAARRQDGARRRAHLPRRPARASSPDRRAGGARDADRRPARRPGADPRGRASACGSTATRTCPASRCSGAATRFDADASAAAGRGPRRRRAGR